MQVDVSAAITRQDWEVVWTTQTKASPGRQAGRVWIIRERLAEDSILSVCVSLSLCAFLLSVGAPDWWILVKAN